MFILCNFANSLFKYTHFYEFIACVLWDPPCMDHFNYDTQFESVGQCKDDFFFPYMNKQLMYVQVKDVLVRCSFLLQWGEMFKEASWLIWLYIHMIIFLV
jgi:hypothetical protein